MLLVGMQSGAATLRGSLAFFFKTKRAPTMPSSNFAPWYLLKGVKNLYPHKNLHMDV